MSIQTWVLPYNSIAQETHQKPSVPAYLKTPYKQRVLGA